MGHQDDAHTQFLLELVEQLHDLILDGYVQRGGGLVGQQQLGPGAQGDGNHGALAHAAGELVGILIQTGLGGGDAHQLEQFNGPPALLLLGQLLPLKGLVHLAADAQHRIEGGHGLLEDHGDLLAPDFLQLPLAHFGDVRPLVADFAAGDPAGLLQQAQDGAEGLALAAARLAHQAEGLPLEDLEGDAVHGADGLPLAGEGHVEITDFK